MRGLWNDSEGGVRLDWSGRTHWGDGAPQSTHLLFSFVLDMVWSLDRVSGSTSHILLLILGEQGGGSGRLRAGGVWIVQGFARRLLSSHVCFVVEELGGLG